MQIFKEKEIKGQQNDPEIWIAADVVQEQVEGAIIQCFPDEHVMDFNFIAVFGLHMYIRYGKGRVIHIIILETFASLEITEIFENCHEWNYPTLRCVKMDVRHLEPYI